MNNSFTFIPLLAILNLDNVLLPFFPDFVKYPCSKKNGKIVDANDTILECYPEVPAVFEKLKNANIKIATIALCMKLNETLELIHMFGWNNYFSYIELDQGMDPGRLEKIQKKSNIPFEKMIYYVDDLYDFETVQEMVHTVYVDFKEGITLKLLDEGLKEYDSKLREMRYPS